VTEASSGYVLRTPAGRSAAARRAATSIARHFDEAIAIKRAELEALEVLKHIVIAAPQELLSRGWVPVLIGPDDPIEWQPPQS
jgi:hypothetical protein